MKKFKILLLLFPLFAFSHGGHDHDAPSKVAAPKGGVIKELENTYVEVVSKQKDLKIYLYDKELKPKSSTGFKIELEAELPRTKKKEIINSLTTVSGFEASYDAKKLHRYTLLIKITDPSTGHTDKLKYTIEPR